MSTGPGKDDKKAPHKPRDSKQSKTQKRQRTGETKETAPTSDVDDKQETGGKSKTTKRMRTPGDAPENTSEMASASTDPANFDLETQSMAKAPATVREPDAHEQSKMPHPKSTAVKAKAAKPPEEPLPQTLVEAKMETEPKVEPKVEPETEASEPEAKTELMEKLGSMDNETAQAVLAALNKRSASDLSLGSEPAQEGPKPQNKTGPKGAVATNPTGPSEQTTKQPTAVPAKVSKQTPEADKEHDNKDEPSDEEAHRIKAAQVEAKKEAHRRYMRFKRSFESSLTEVEPVVRTL